ncbi:flagellar basal body-associated FliL family protein [Marinobacter salicampi]|uniref:flagellar basal body-associated FliL family protein n=1 Tax=Marinobacter salicampi TaxID=435907 RepID=UPI0014098955|nr:flagellar basal body-associated FliL family protein [Marinobacter salicampi]
MKKRPLCIFVLTSALMVLPATLPQALAQADEEMAEEGGEATPKTTIYVDMKPAFITHVGKSDNKLTYLKADVTLRTSSEAAEDAVNAHMPRLRHELVMLMGNSTDVDELSSPAGQQDLRERAKSAINEVLAQQQLEVQVDDVLFTSFVVQR